MSAQVPTSPTPGWLFDLRPLRGSVLTVATHHASKARQHFIDHLVAVGVIGSPADAEALLDEIDAEAAAVL